MKSYTESGTPISTAVVKVGEVLKTIMVIRVSEMWIVTSFGTFYRKTGSWIGSESLKLVFVGNQEEAQKFLSKA